MQIHAKNVARDLAKLVFWFPVRWCVLLLPFAALDWVSRLAGRIDLLLSGRLRARKMASNIERTLEVAPAAAHAILRRNLQSYCRSVLEFIKYPQMNPANIDTLVLISGRDHLDAALKQGHGVILLTAHFVDKQLLQVGLGHKGYPINQINYHLPPDVLSFIEERVGQRQRQRIEARIPATFIPADGFMRPVLQCLRQNQVLIMAGDGSGLKDRMTSAYVAAKFLGRTMRFPPQGITLAQRTGAVALPAFAIRDGRQAVIEIGAPLDVRTVNAEEGVIQFARVLEDYVRRYPHLWEFWEEFEEGHLLTAEGGPGHAAL